MVKKTPKGKKSEFSLFNMGSINTELPKIELSESDIKNMNSGFVSSSFSLPVPPDVVGLNKVEAINIIVKSGYGYMVFNIGNKQGAREINHNIVFNQTMSENIICLNVYNYNPNAILPNVIGMNVYEAKSFLISLGWDFYLDYVPYTDGLWPGIGGNRGPSTGINTVADVACYFPSWSLLSPGTVNIGQKIILYYWTEPEGWVPDF